MTRTLPTNVRIFRSSGAAYDACNSDETMPFGTIFMVPDEKIVGIAWAWPVSVSFRWGNLHRFEDDPRTVKGNLDAKVIAAMPAAMRLSQAVGWDLDCFLCCLCPAIGIDFDEFDHGWD